MLVYWNNDLINVENKSDYQFFDRAFHFGDGIYETIAIKKGKPVFLQEHLERLILNAVRLDIPIDGTSNWIGYTDNIIQSNEINEGFIKVIVTRGTIADAGLGYPKPIKPSVFMWGEKCKCVPLKEKKPYKVLISQPEKRNPYSLVTYTKTLNYLSNIIAKNEADEAGCDEAIFVNTDGNLSEGTTSNLFFVDEDRKISTPEVTCGLLNGVVRTKVIETAVKLGFEVDEGVFTPDKFKKVKGCFLTSSLMDMTPVIEIVGIAKYNISDFIEIMDKIDSKYQTLT